MKCKEIVQTKLILKKRVAYFIELEMYFLKNRVYLLTLKEITFKTLLWD
jgi:hypothetical protein